MTIRHATGADLPFLQAHDHHIAPAELQRSVEAGRVLIAEKIWPVGWLRWGLFWDNTPMCNLLYVLEPHRHNGLGAALMARWEQEVADYPFVLVSTQSDEDAQHFYRRLGYRDAGARLLPAEPAELFFWKGLR